MRAIIEHTVTANLRLRCSGVARYMSTPLTWPKMVPVFPLPEVVLFPRQLLALHIFEPRYREMVSDVLCGEGLIAIALLKPGYERAYFTPHAPIHQVVGVGQIVTAERLDDDRFNVLLRGVTRGQIVHENRERAYRMAEVRGCACESALDCEEGRLHRERLWKTAVAGGLRACVSQAALERLFEADIPVGSLVDLLAAGAPIDCELRQALLEELDVRKRSELLLESLTVLNAIRQAQCAGRGTAAYNPN